MALSRSSFSSGKGKRKGAKVDSFTMIVGGVFAIAFLIVVGAFLHLSSTPSDARTVADVELQPSDVGEILVPVETVQVGSNLQPTMFRRDVRAEDQITGDMIRSYDELKGQYAKGVLIKNQPILKAALTNRQPVHVLTAMLPKNYRAVALQVERPLLDNVDGWAQPGTDVDVVWITQAFGREMAAVLAGPVRVLAANKTTEYQPKSEQGEDFEKLVTVTLLLTTRDAMRVSLAAMHGKITLGLRGIADNRPNDASRPISSVLEESVSPEMPKPVISVRVVDPVSREREVRTYDTNGRRLGEQG
jgi:Flp pilus assembly protein CpaB